MLSRLVAGVALIIPAAVIWLAPHAAAQGTIDFGTNPPIIISPPTYNPPPTNDDFSNAAVLAGYSVTITGDNSWATAETGEPSHNGSPPTNSVWWKWTAPASGVVELHQASASVGSGFNGFVIIMGPIPVRVALYTGNQLTNLSPVPLLGPAAGANGALLTNSARVRFSVVAGETYNLAVDRNFTWVSFTLTMQLGTIELVEPATTTNLPGNANVELEFAALDAAEQIVFLQAFSDTGSLGVRTNPPFRFLFSPPIAGSASVFAFGVNGSGQPIRALATPLTFFLANDNFEDAAVLHGFSATATGNNIGATAETGEPLHAGSNPKHSVWWQWTAPADANVEIAAVSTSPSVIVIGWGQPPATNYAQTFRAGVYTENRAENLTPVLLTGNRFFATAGQTYRIAVDGNTPGPFKLSLKSAALQIVEPTTTKLPSGMPVEFEFAPFDTNMTLVWLGAVAGSQTLGVRTNPPFRFTMPASAPAFIAVSAEGTNSAGERVIAFLEDFLIQLGNDDFTNALPVSPSTTKGTFAADARYATVESGEPALVPGSPSAHTAWWQWTPGYSVQADITLHSPNSKLAVFKGSNLQTLQRIGFVQNNSSSSQPPIIIFPPPAPVFTGVSFVPEAGTTYYVAVDGPAAVSWSLDQKTFQIQMPQSQRGFVNTPMQLVAIDHEAGGSNAQFIIGQQVWSPWGNTPPVPIGSLDGGSVSPYGAVWIPDQPGTFYVWARMTNSQGIVHETSPVQYQIFVENDDFDRATVIPSATRETNCVFTLAGTSSETNEPLHQTTPAIHSRWWKWTPSYSGKIRLKAVNGDLSGAALDVFLKSSAGKLKRIAHNDGRTFMPGYSGLIELTVKSGATYFIRVDDAGAPSFPNPFPFEQTFPPITLTLEPANKPLVAELNLSFILTKMEGHPRRRTLRSVVAARVYLPDRQTPVTASNFRAQLYVGKTSATLQPRGTPQLFFPDYAFDFLLDLDGTVIPTPVMLAGLLPHSKAYAQVRVWDSIYGDSYETAKANGGQFGESAILKVITGSELTGPAPLNGIRSFVLKEGVTPIPVASAISATISADPQAEPQAVSLHQAETNGYGTDGRIKWQLTGPTGFRYAIEASSLSNAWEEILILTNTSGSIVFTDPRASLPGISFYRARLLED